MKLGVTATQQGLSDRQKRDFKQYLEASDPATLELHHGDCVGGDTDMHDIAIELRVARIVIHPPINEKKRAFCHERPDRWGERTRYTEIVVLPAKDYIARNHDIVDTTEALVAGPKGNQEELRSGTWGTVRYARRTDKGVVILPR